MPRANRKTCSPCCGKPNRLTTSKINFNRFPVIWLSVHGQKSLTDINRIVQDELKQHIESIKGCGGVFFGGMRRQAQDIEIAAGFSPKRNQVVIVQHGARCSAACSEYNRNGKCPSIGK